MARNFTSTSYLEIAGTAVTSGPPMTWFCWFKPNGDGVSDKLMSIAKVSEATRFFVIQTRGDVAGDPLQMWTRGGGSNVDDTSNSINFNVWNSACGRWTSTTARDVILNGDFANKGSSTAAGDPGAMDTTSIGRIGDSSPSTSDDVDIAEAAMWNVVLDDAEVAALAVGYSPDHIRPQSRAGHWRIFGRNSPETDLIVPNNLVVTGTAAVVPHPRIIYPKRKVYVGVAGAAPAADEEHEGFFESIRTDFQPMRVVSY